MPFNPKWLIGRTIVRVDYDTEQAREDGVADGEKYHPNPVLHLDNGARVHFHTEESDWGEYGVAFTYVSARNRK